MIQSQTDSITETQTEHCLACVFYPANLPAHAYSAEDYRMLQAKDCCFEFQPGDQDCEQTRKTSCSLLDLEHLKKAPPSKEAI